MEASVTVNAVKVGRAAPLPKTNNENARRRGEKHESRNIIA